MYQVCSGSRKCEHPSTHQGGDVWEVGEEMSRRELEGT